MLEGILLFLLMCVFVNIVTSIFGKINLIGGVLLIIDWIGHLPVIAGIAVCVAPFIIACILSNIIKASRKKK